MTESPGATALLRSPTLVVAGDDVTGVPLPSWVVPALRNAGAIDGTRVSNVGFVWGPDRLLVILPKAYAAEDARARLADDPEWALSQAFLLIRLLARCRRDGRFRALRSVREAWIERAPSTGADVVGALEAALMLRADFLERGLYWERSPLYRANDPSNPVDWPRTLRSRPPLLDENGVVWFDTVHRARARDPRDPVHRLHAWAVANVLALTGESPLSPRGPFLTASERDTVAANPGRYVDALLARTYRDRGRHLLRLIGAWTRRSPDCRRARRTPRPRPPARPVVRERVGARPPRAPRQHRGVRVARFRPGPGHRRRPDSSRGKGAIVPKVDIRRQSDLASRSSTSSTLRTRPSSPGRTGSAADHYKQVVYAQLLDLPVGSDLVNALLFPAVMPVRTVRVLGVHGWPTRLQRSRVVEAAVDFERVVRAWLGDASLDPEAIVADLRAQAEETEMEAA